MFVLLAIVLYRLSSPETTVREEVARFIVQGADPASLQRAVKAAGGEVVDHLAIIDAVVATLDRNGLKRLRDDPAVRRVYADRVLRFSHSEVKTGSPMDDDDSGSDVDDSLPGLDTAYPGLVDATRLHGWGITGRNVTIAVVDTGLWAHPAVEYDHRGNARVPVRYDAIQDREWTDGDASGFVDESGHGTHVASIAVSSLRGPSGSYNGIAPGARLVPVRAFDKHGDGHYVDVIRGLDWILDNRDDHDIRVVNLSFSADPNSFYWDDPLNQAVMKLWEKGIVVVVSAGNTGPSPMTVGVPGNVPYVITVGAMTDNYTPADPADDMLASFSSSGPTIEGFVKPEVVAPGGHMLATMDPLSDLADRYPDHVHGLNRDYFSMSGTSQSTAVVTGIVALMLEVAPFLTPDEVKCALMRGDAGQ